MEYRSFLDAREIGSGTNIGADLCVVGAGAAGITIAREFANADIRVCLLEAGGLFADPLVNRLSEIDYVGRRTHKDVNGDRLRYFGGTTNHWGGHCVPSNQMTLKSTTGLRIPAGRIATMSCVLTMSEPMTF